MKRSLKTGFRTSYLNVWILLLRILTTGFMFTHGLPKLSRLMSGGEIKFADPIGIGPVSSMILATFAEVVCSALILVGLGTRLATIPLMINMTVAAFFAHADDPFARKELPLLYLFLYITLCILGSGKYSVDFLLQRRLDSKKQ